MVMKINKAVGLFHTSSIKLRLKRTLSMAFRIQNYDNYNLHENSEGIQKFGLHGFKASITESQKNYSLNIKAIYWR